MGFSSLSHEKRDEKDAPFLGWREMLLLHIPELASAWLYAHFSDSPQFLGTTWGYNTMVLPVKITPGLQPPGSWKPSYLDVCCGFRFYKLHFPSMAHRFVGLIPLYKYDEIPMNFHKKSHDFPMRSSFFIGSISFFSHKKSHSNPMSDSYEFPPMKSTTFWLPGSPMTSGIPGPGAQCAPLCDPPSCKTSCSRGRPVFEEKGWIFPCFFFFWGGGVLVHGDLRWFSWDLMRFWWDLNEILMGFEWNINGIWMRYKWDFNEISMGFQWDFTGKNPDLMRFKQQKWCGHGILYEGFLSHGGIPNSWMVFVRENPIIKWMMSGGTPISRNHHIWFSPMFWFVGRDLRDIWWFVMVFNVDIMT